MKKYWIFFILFFTQTVNGSFLRIDDTALSFGIGSGGASYIKGASALLINPASTYYNKAFNVVLSQYFGPESLACSYVSLVKGFQNLGTFGIVLKGFYPLDKIKGFNEKAEPIEDDIGFYDYLIGINYSRKLLKVLNGDLYGGVNIKYIEQALWTYSSYGIAGDIGVLYDFYNIRDLKIGFSYQNIGKVLKGFLDNEYNYPGIMRFGITFSDNIFLNKLKEKRNLFFILDLIIAEKNKADYLCLGSVYKFRKIINIKAGYKLRIGAGTQDIDYLRNLRAGLGINLNRISINYSMAPKSNKANQFLNFFDLSFIF